MWTILLLAVGGALGTLARFGLGQVLPRGAFPWGTVAVNALGSLAIGLLMGAWLADARAEEWRYFLVVGFLGAFTTMSAFAYESITLLSEGRLGPWALHMVLHPALAVVAAGVGLALARAWT